MKVTKSCSKTRQLYMTRRVAAHTQVRECALIIFTHRHTHKKKKKKEKRKGESIICVCVVLFQFNFY